MTEFQFPLILALMGLLGSSIVFWKIQTGAIESWKMVAGASLLLVVSGAALAVLALESSAARAGSDVRIGAK